MASQGKTTINNIGEQQLISHLQENNNGHHRNPTMDITGLQTWALVQIESYCKIEKTPLVQLQNHTAYSCKNLNLNYNRSTLKLPGSVNLKHTNKVIQQKNNNKRNK